MAVSAAALRETVAKAPASQSAPKDLIVGSPLDAAPVQFHLPSRFRLGGQRQWRVKPRQVALIDLETMRWNDRASRIVEIVQRRKRQLQIFGRLTRGGRQRNRRNPGQVVRALGDTRHQDRRGCGVRQAIGELRHGAGLDGSVELRRQGNGLRCAGIILDRLAGLDRQIQDPRACGIDR